MSFTKNVFAVSFLFIIMFFCIPSYVSAETFVESDITEDTIWTLADGPYIVSGQITVAEGATLTINPGVVVKFLDYFSGLTILGSLSALGTASHPIYFTSYADDRGGDSNNDNEDSIPLPGDWDGIIFSNTGTNTISINHASFNYTLNGLSFDNVVFSGSNISCEYSNECLFLSHSNLTIDHFLGKYIEGQVVTVYDQSTLTLTNSNISNVSQSDFNQYVFTVFNNSALSLNQVIVSNILDQVGGIDLFNTSTLSVNGSTFSQFELGDVITVFNDSVVSVMNSLFDEGLENGIILFNHTNLSFIKTKIKNFGGTGLYDLGSGSSYGPNNINLDEVEIVNNGHGLSVDDNLVFTGTNVSLYDNIQYGAYAYTSVPFQLENIWWGSPSGPYNNINNISGTGNQVSDLVDAYPYLSNDPLNPEPLEYYAKISGSTNGFVKLYESPDTNSTLIKTLPNDWVVKVVQKSDENNQPVFSGGFRWYKVEDLTDGSRMWMIVGSSTDTESLYLPYNQSLQDNLTHLSKDILDTRALRREIILEAIDHYYNNIDTAKSLYSSNDTYQNISLLKEIGLPKEVLLAIIAQESASVNFNNEFVSYDYGHGAMQITFHAWANEPNNFIKNNWDNRGKKSNVFIDKCKNLDINLLRGARGLSEYKKCYSNTETQNKKSKPYKHYDDIVLSPVYKQYANTIQSIYANIKDGLGNLREKFVFTQSCPRASKIIQGVTFTCEDMQKIMMVWAYNGVSLNSSYLLAVSQKLANISTYFPGISYSNTDNFVEKLAIANANKKTVKVYSPVELRVIDSNGNISGLVDGQIVNNIPGALYDPEEEKVDILFPEDIYVYQVVGVQGGGTYDFVEENTTNGLVTTVKAIDLPIVENEIHTYQIDDTAIAQGEEGVTLAIDKNADGVSDQTIVTGSTLTDITPPMVDLNNISDEYFLGEKIDLKNIVTDNESKHNKISISATWDNVPLVIHNKKITVPTIGDHVLSITAVDEVGNSATFLKNVHVSYQFLGFKPINFDDGSFKKNKPLVIKFRIKAKNGITIPLLHPTLSVVRVSDGFHAQVNPNTLDEDPDCDIGDECFINYHNRYKRILPSNLLTTGQWRVTVGLNDGNEYTSLINIIN